MNFDQRNHSNYTQDGQQVKQTSGWHFQGRKWSIVVSSTGNLCGGGVWYTLGTANAGGDLFYAFDRKIRKMKNLRWSEPENKYTHTYGQNFLQSFWSPWKKSILKSIGRQGCLVVPSAWKSSLIFK